LPNADQVALIDPWCPESDIDDRQPPTGPNSAMNISDVVGMMFGRRRQYERRPDSFTGCVAR
jgi:hypothetical protein